MVVPLRRPEQGLSGGADGAPRPPVGTRRSACFVPLNLVPCLAMPLLRFLPSGRALSVEKGSLLIDAVHRAGLPIARACGDELVCAKCGVRVLEGRLSREAPVERNAKRRNGVEAELRLACAVRVHDDLVLHADYWGPLE